MTVARLSGGPMDGEWIDVATTSLQVHERPHVTLRTLYDACGAEQPAGRIGRYRQSSRDPGRFYWAGWES